MQKISITLLIAFFLPLLSIMGGGIFRYITDTEIDMSTAENRRLSQFRTINFPSGLSELNRLGTEFEEAARDQILFRDTIGRSVRKLQVYQFNRTTSDEIILGQNGFWFSTGGRILPLIPCASPNPINESNTQRLQTAFVNFGKRMNMLGVTVSLMIVPLQSTIASKHLPKQLESLCQEPPPRLLETIYNVSSSGIHTYYDPEWMQQQPPTNIYHPKSFHWSPEGALLYSHYGIWSRQLVPEGFKQVSLDEKSITKVRDIDIARYLGVAPMFHEYEYPKIKQSVLFQGNVENAIKDGILNPSFANIYKKGATKLGQYMEGGLPFNGRGLIIGDSFSRMAFDYLGRHFEAALGGTTNTLILGTGQLEELVQQFNANHVILIFAESKFTPVKGSPSWKHIADYLTSEKD